MSSVVTWCVGKASCTFNVSNADLGGDPCPSVPKKFQVSYGCDFGCPGCNNNVTIGRIVAAPVLASSPATIAANTQTLRFSINGSLTVNGPHIVSVTASGYSGSCGSAKIVANGAGNGYDVSCTAPSGIPSNTQLTITYTDQGSGAVVSFTTNSVPGATVTAQSNSIASLASSIVITGSNFVNNSAAFVATINGVSCTAKNILPTSFTCELASTGNLGAVGTDVVITGTMYGGPFTAKIGVVAKCSYFQLRNSALDVFLR
jgi:hypothetical protein